MDVPTLAAIAGLAMTGGGLVWGAAKIATAVNTLSISVDKLDNVVERLEKAVSSLNTRVTVLEDRAERTG